MIGSGASTTSCASCAAWRQSTLSRPAACPMTIHQRVTRPRSLPLVIEEWNQREQPAPATSDQATSSVAAAARAGEARRRRRVVIIADHFAGLDLLFPECPEVDAGALPSSGVPVSQPSALKTSSAVA